MRYFQHLANGVKIVPLLDALQRHKELWNQNTLRTTHPGSPHTQVDDILIRFQDLALFEKTQDPYDVLDQHENIWFPAANVLPVQSLVFDLMRLVQAERLGRVLITRLGPGKSITPHIDSGDHAAYYDRYHICLQARPGAVFRCGDEEVYMQDGELWWVDNASLHEVVNNSVDDRLHLIIDLKIR